MIEFLDNNGMSSLYAREHSHIDSDLNLELRGFRMSNPNYVRAYSLLLILIVGSDNGWNVKLIEDGVKIKPSYYNRDDNRFDKLITSLNNNMNPKINIPS